MTTARRRELVFNLNDNRRVLVAGSVSAIVEWLLERNTGKRWPLCVYSNHLNPFFPSLDVSKLRIFLNTYRSFIKPKDLFILVVQRFTSETDPRPMKRWSKLDPHMFFVNNDVRRYRALFFIKEWITYHSKDFRDGEVASNLNIFLRLQILLFEEIQTSTNVTLL